MSSSSGRGKQSFRVFSKALNDEVRYITGAVKDGEQYTSGDVYRFLSYIVNEYTAFLRDNGLDVELWGDRALDYSLQKYEYLVNRFNLPEGIMDDNEYEPDEEPEEDEGPETESQDTGQTLLGHSVMDEANKPLIRSKGKPRKRILTTLAELEEYVSDVPYVLAIQVLLSSSGGVVGYRVWVEASKDKRRKKNAS